jgi:hypothetical protein
MGNAGSDYGYFQRALKAGHYASAWQFAHQLSVVSLEDALSLTLLAARKDPDHFEAMAQRWMAKLLEEKQLTPYEIRWVTERLQDVKEDRLSGVGQGAGPYYDFSDSLAAEAVSPQNAWRRQMEGFGPTVPNRDHPAARIRFYRGAG